MFRLKEKFRNNNKFKRSLCLIEREEEERLHQNFNPLNFNVILLLEAGIEEIMMDDG